MTILTWAWPPIQLAVLMVVTAVASTWAILIAYRWRPRGDPRDGWVVIGGPDEHPPARPNGTTAGRLPEVEAKVFAVLEARESGLLLGGCRASPTSFDDLHVLVCCFQTRHALSDTLQRLKRRGLVVHVAGKGGGWAVAREDGR